MSDDERAAHPDDGSATAGDGGSDGEAGGEERADDVTDGASTAPWTTAGVGEEPTLSDIAAEEEKPEGTPSTGYLPNLPDVFVTFGAGSLATAVLLSLAGFGFVLWMTFTGNVRDLLPYQMTLAAILMGFATAILAGGSYFATKRIHWTLTMLAALVGSFAVVTIPFTAVAVVCIGLGRVHFTTPFVGDVSPTADEPNADE
ncbi:MAG: hypothetical protein ABEJ81_06900 [Haloferacaceae archaeon]